MTVATRNADMVAVAYRAPFAQGRGRLLMFEPSDTVAQMVAKFPDLPPDFAQRGFILVDGHEMERRHWRRIRVKPGKEIVFAYALADGHRSGSGKAVLGLIVAVATILTAGAAAAGAFGAGAGTWFGVGTLSAKVLAGGISLIGSLAQAALSKPPAAAEKTKRDEQPGAASATGNVLSAGAPIPRVIGTRRAYPMLAAPPITVRDGRDEIAEAVFVMAGPHKVESILIGDTAIEDADDIEIEVHEGWPDDPPESLVTRYGIMKSPSMELSAPVVDGDSQDRLKNQSNPEKNLPQWHGVSTSATPADEFRIDLTFPQGLYNTQNSDRYRMAFRLRMRKSADDPWINLPEIHYASDDNKEIRANIILKWGAAPENAGQIPVNEGWVAAYKLTPNQPAPSSTGWVADASFSAGAGNDYLASATPSSNVRRMTLGQFDAVFFLDPVAIPPGSYQVQIKRSVGFKNSSFSVSAYTYGGTVCDPFFYVIDDGYEVMQTRQNVSDTVYLIRATSLFNAHPINEGLPGSGLTVIAARARNRAMDQLSALLSGYVRDWDGTGWNDWITTSNPAPHFHDVLRGYQTPDPLDAELIDIAGIVDWRQACIDLGYTVDMICEGDQLSEVAERIAGCGFARVRMSDTWGIIRDYDRSGDDPVQVFTARNMSGFKMSKAFARLPDAFRVVWPDGDTRDARDETVIFRDGREDIPNPRIEEVNYEGFKTEAAAVRRGTFDLRQGEYRSAFYSWSAPLEAIVCQRGDLVGINHYVIERTHDSARIADVEIVDGNIVALQLDAPVQVYNEVDMLDVADMLVVPDMLLIGAETGVSIRDADSVLAVPQKISGPSGLRDRLVMAAPFAAVLDDDDEPLIRAGNLAWVGQPGRELLRLVVSDIKYGRDHTAQITAVDDASEALFAA